MLVASKSPRGHAGRENCRWQTDVGFAGRLRHLTILYRAFFLPPFVVYTQVPHKIGCGFPARRSVGRWSWTVLQVEGRRHAGTGCHSPRRSRRQDSAAPCVMFTALFVLCSLAVARAATVVCVDGDAGQDGPACGVPPSPCCATLRHAIHNITNHSPHANSTVVMAPGVYGPTSCDITVTQSVSVVGAGRDATVINCASTARVMQVFSPLVSLSLSGLTLSHGQVDDRWVGGPSGGCVLVRWDWDGSGVAEGARGLVAPAVSLEGVRLSHCYAGSDELDWVVGGGLGVILTGAVETAGAWVSVADSVFESNVANSRSGSDAIGGGFGLLLNSTELTAGLQVWLVGNDFRHNAADAANSGACFRLLPVTVELSVSCVCCCGQ